MFSNIVPFSTILESIKDDTGIVNIQPLVPKIRRLIYRIQRDIGFGGAVILKKKTYRISDQTIIENEGNFFARLPEDLMFFDEVGTCKDGLCPSDYIIQGNNIFLCKKIDQFSIIYYSILLDGEGNPVTTLNHMEAVISGVAYYMYKARRFSDKGNANTLYQMETYYEDRVGEARGDDAMPSTRREWDQLARILNSSSRDFLIFDNDKSCFCSLPDEISETDEVDKNKPKDIFYWQFHDLMTDINFAPQIDMDYLLLRNRQSFSYFESGSIVSYENIGRIAFAIREVEENRITIFDILGNDITSIVFQTYYNSQLKTQIFISREYYTHGNIFFKIKYN